MQQLVLEKKDNIEENKAAETEKKISEEIFTLALSTRKRFAKINREIREFPNNLSGSCAIVSAILFKVLKDKGYQPIFWCGESCTCGHCWIELDGFIIDLTATQFGNRYRIVTVIPKEELGKHKAYSYIKLTKHDSAPAKPTWDQQSPHSKLAKTIYRKFFHDLDMTCIRNKVYIKNMTF